MNPFLSLANKTKKGNGGTLSTNQKAMDQENEFVTTYKRVFPSHSPTIFQMDMIVGRIVDATAWNQTLEFWAGNDYRPQSIFKMVNYYDELIANRKGDWSQVGRHDPDRAIELDAPCDICGQDFCLKEHKQERIAV